MNFEQILTELKNQKPVARKSWKTFDWIYLNNEIFIAVWDEFGFYESTFYNLTSEDILANDWIVLEN